MNEQKVVNAINHQRHDWMNDLQLISGYIQLGKWDKLKSITEQIVQKSNQNSRLFRVGSAKLSLALFVIATTTTNFEIDIQMDPNYTFQGSDAACTQLVGWLDDHINELTNRMGSSYNETNVLHIHLEQRPDKWSVRLKWNEEQEIVGQGQLHWNEVE